MTQEISLSEVELEQLDMALLDNEDGMAIDEAHGYLTALAVIGQRLESSTIAKIIYGTEESPDNQGIIMLLMKLHDDIQQTLDSGQHFEPLYIEVDDEDITYLDYEGWCHGFMFGLSETDIDWESVDSNIKDLIAPISQIALADEDGDDELSDEDYAVLIDMIPGSVSGLYQQWH